MTNIDVSWSDFSDFLTIFIAHSSKKNQGHIEIQFFLPLYRSNEYLVRISIKIKKIVPFSKFGMVYKMPIDFSDTTLEDSVWDIFLF